jgi:hypothetical protein
MRSKSVAGRLGPARPHAAHSSETAPSGRLCYPPALSLTHCRPPSPRHGRASEHASEGRPGHPRLRLNTITRQSGRTPSGRRRVGIDAGWYNGPRAKTAPCADSIVNRFTCEASSLSSVCTRLAEWSSCLSSSPNWGVQVQYVAGNPVRRLTEQPPEPLLQMRPFVAHLSNGFGKLFKALIRLKSDSFTPRQV